MGAALLFLSLFFVFILHLPKHAGFGDTGSMAVSIHYLTLSHPPSYPVYLCLSRLFALLPLQSPLFGYHLFSALCWALLVYPLSALARRLLGAPDRGLVAAAAVILFPVYLNLALTLEAYPFQILLFFSSLSLLREADFRRCAAGLFALALGGHPLFIVAGLAFAGRGLWLGRRLGALCFLGSLPLWLWVYVPLRSEADPLGRFDLSSTSDFLQYMGAAGFQEFSLPRLGELDKVLRLAPLGPLLTVIPLAFLGLRRIRPGREGTVTALWRAVATIAILSFPAYLSFDLPAYLTPVAMLVLVFALGAISPKARPPLFLIAGLIGIGGLGALSASTRDASHMASLRLQLLDELPPRSLLVIPNSSTLYGFGYLADILVEGRRGDVVPVVQMYLKLPRYVEGLIALGGAPSEAEAYARLEGEPLRQLLKDSFYDRVFDQAPFLLLLDFVGRGRIKEGMANHVRNLLIAGQILGTSARPVALLNRELLDLPLAQPSSARFRYRQGVWLFPADEGNLLLAVPPAPPGMLSAWFYAQQAADLRRTGATGEGDLPDWVLEHPEYRHRLNPYATGITARFLYAFTKETGISPLR